MDITATFLEKARELVGPQLINTYHSGLDEFQFASGKRTWHLVWVQWCALYLNDKTFVEFFRRAGESLAHPNGAVVMKDNVLPWHAPPLPNTDDGSITRSDAHLKCLFAAAGLEVVAEQVQTGMPAHLFPVKSYALRPKRA